MKLGRMVCRDQEENPIIFQDNRCTKTSLGEEVPKGALLVFDRIASKLDIVISSDERNILADFHNNRYILRAVRAEKGP